MNQSTHRDEVVGSVEAALNYLAETAEKPVTYMYKTENGAPQRTYHNVKHMMTILNGRAVDERVSLDGQGFALVHHPTAVANFYDEAEVRAVYYPEVERLVKQATGAVRVVVFDHNVRCGPMAKEGRNGAREPVRFAHNDYTLKSGPQRVRDLLGAEAEALLKNRFVFINVWRPIRGPVEEAPLAVCDAQSMRLADFVATDLKYRDRTGEVYSVAFNPEHRWFYFPRMLREEALLLKCYDSAADGRARWTAHTAFDDPTSPPNAAPRESIEARTIAFFAPEKRN
ncbi:MAG TPA: CmcJ/NvfI family oxidoreductase [Candidatus Binataceae bacterium]